MMLHNKYQCSSPCDFRHEDFFMFPYVKRVTPWSQEHNLNKLGRGLLDDAKYQGLQTRIFFMFSLNKHM